MRVAIVGAGPGGAAAAAVLARAGARVVVYERARWPRPKTCGDGVTPDGLRALAALRGTIPDDAPRCPDATVVAPRGATCVGRWNGLAAVVPRDRFDADVAALATAAGAELRDATTVVAVEDGAVAARPSSASDGAPEMRERYDAIVLAEGAAGSLAPRLGLGAFRERQVAVRGYADARVDLRPTYNVIYDAALSPGYGWIFPISARRANVGVCVPEAQGRVPGGPRALLEAWLARDPAVAALLGPAPRLDDVRGGVIPSVRPRRRAGRVLAVGDAAGVADPLSAEGISQALVTGAAAGAALLAADGDLDAAERAFAPTLRDHDRNAREARRLRALFRWTLDPMIALAARKPALADHLVRAGFTLKTDGRWFHGVRGVLLRPGRAPD